MKEKPVTPYARLLEKVNDFASKVAYPRRVAMFWYAKAKLGDGWSLTDLYERTKAADQLGYDVVLLAKDDGLHVQYVQRRPTWL
jgi:hypothetical protein